MLFDTEYIATYTKDFSTCGFKPKHKYRIFPEDLGREGYSVSGLYDITDDCAIDLYITFSNTKGLEEYFSCD